MRLTQLVLFFLLYSYLPAQIVTSLNLPRKIAVGVDREFEIRINKGSVTNFSKFQLAVPEGLIIKEVESKGGSFTFENQQAKVIWAITPTENEISIKLAVNAASKGTYTLGPKYYYLENEGKREIEFETFSFEAVDPSGAGEGESDFIVLKQHVPEAFPVSASRNKNVNPDNPQELHMHAMQLKKDSREAFKVGEAERKKAEENLDDANTILLLSEHLEEGSQKQKVVKQANAARDRAQVDIQVANKILSLAESLEKDAQEIEKLNAAGKALATTGENDKKAAASGGRTPEGGSTKTGSTPAPGTIVYRLQLGAFGRQPAKSGFKSLGNVVILNEEGLYKVLLGSYQSKDEALKQREQVVAKGYDAFVVSYKDGVRLK
jgi:cell division protein FtsN